MTDEDRKQYEIERLRGMMNRPSWHIPISTGPGEPGTISYYKPKRSYGWLWKGLLWACIVCTAAWLGAQWGAR